MAEIRPFSNGCWVCACVSGVCAVGVGRLGEVNVLEKDLREALVDAAAVPAAFLCLGRGCDTLVLVCKQAFPFASGT